MRFLRLVSIIQISSLILSGLADRQQAFFISDQEKLLAVRVASCRANCADNFLLSENDTKNDLDCQMNSPCFMCWEQCGFLAKNFDIWSSICDDPFLCFEGCQLACLSYNPEVLQLKFTKLGTGINNDQTVWLDRDFSKSGFIRIRMEKLAETKRPQLSIVSVLFWFDTITKNFEQLNQTLGHSFFSNDQRIVSTKNNPNFIILLVTKNGLIAEWATPTLEKLLDSSKTLFSSLMAFFGAFTKIHLLILIFCIIFLFFGFSVYFIMKKYWFIYPKRPLFQRRAVLKIRRVNV